MQPRPSVLSPNALGTRDEALIPSACQTMGTTLSWQFITGFCFCLFLFYSLLILVNSYGVPELHKGERPQNFSNQRMLHRLAVCTDFSWP